MHTSSFMLLLSIVIQIHLSFWGCSPHKCFFLSYSRTISELLCPILPSTYIPPQVCLSTTWREASKKKNSVPNQVPTTTIMGIERAPPQPLPKKYHTRHHPRNSRPYSRGLFINQPSSLNNQYGPAMSWEILVALWREGLAP